MPLPRTIQQVGTNNKPVTTLTFLSAFTKKKDAILEAESSHMNSGHSIDNSNPKVWRFRYRGRYARGWYVKHRAVLYGQHYGRPAFLSLPRYIATHTAFAPDSWAVSLSAMSAGLDDFRITSERNFTVFSNFTISLGEENT